MFIYPCFFQVFSGGTFPELLHWVLLSQQGRTTVRKLHTNVQPVGRGMVAGYFFFCTLSKSIWRKQSSISVRFSHNWNNIEKNTPPLNCRHFQNWPLLQETERSMVFHSDKMQLPLFVFLKSDPKQNARSFLTPVTDPTFHALSHGSIGFALHGSFFNHLLIGQNSSTANQNPWNKRLLELPWRTKCLLPCERA